MMIETNWIRYERPSDRYVVKEVRIIDPDHDPRVILDNRRRDRIPASERCEHCGGTGNEHLFTYRECRDCQGTGRIAETGHDDYLAIPSPPGFKPEGYEAFPDSRPGLRPCERREEKDARSS